MLSGADPESIVRCIETVLDQKCEWAVPPEYAVENVSNIVTKIVLGYR
jgi:UDP-N-acetylglucosamine 2-epimerase (non-hydrolysing)